MRLFRALLYVSFALCGCSANDEDDGVARDLLNAPPFPKACRGPSDCTGGMSCQVTDDTAVVSDNLVQQGIAVGLAPAPCDLPCSEPSQCGPDMTCSDPATFPLDCRQCVPGCKHEDCEPGNACEADLCQPVAQCTSEGFAGCPQWWTCDPNPENLSPSSALFPSTPLGYEDKWRAHAAGCRPLRCDEPAARPCPSYTRCDAAGGECVAIPCSELGMCPFGDRVCRAPLAGETADGYGCVQANCEEGFTCAIAEVCDVHGTKPTLRGCRPQFCDEGFTCQDNQRCEPHTAGVDDHGCLTVGFPVGAACQTDAACAMGLFCVNQICSTELGTCR